MREQLTHILAAMAILVLISCSAPSSAFQETETPVPVAAVVSSSNPTPAPTPLSNTILERYVVRSGETLGAISLRYGVPITDLQQANGLANPNALQAGQVLKVPIVVTRVAPADVLLPDSELVYGPGYANFDVAAVAAKGNGYLVSYREKVEGESLTGPQIIQLVAERYSVGPRVLLALLEYQGSWVNSSSLTQNQLNYPMAQIDQGRASLFLQASWAANRLNEGYYGRLSGELQALRFKDRSRVRLAPSVNPGTAAIQNLLAQTAPLDTWLNQISPNGWIATYRRLFGDPNERKVEPLVPADLKQPTLKLPWNEGSTWYYTGGPHSAWGDMAAWSAIDVTPSDTAGSGTCAASREWVVSAAQGRVLRSERGRVIVGLGEGNFQGSGWTLLYMHIAAAGRVSPGTLLNVGDHIGHPSCEGGYANATHMHLARLYNGQWISPETVPFTLSNWAISSLGQEYEGTMTRGSDVRQACNCRDDSKNAIAP